jgi:AcrR family transcriptional regulator
MRIHIGGAMKRLKLSGEERRGQIVRAALAIVAEQGAGSLSIAAVAHRVGLAPSALYRHYPDKDAMIADLLRRVGEGIRANIERAVAEAPEDPLAALGALLQRHVQFVVENRGFPLLLFSDLVTQHPERRRTLLENLDRFRGGVADILREGRRQGLVRPDVNPEAGALAFLGLFIPAGLYWHLAGGRFDITGHARRAWALYLAGIRAPEPSRTSRRAPLRARRRKETVS